MKYVFDVSVAICWVIPRPLTPKADRLRDEYKRKIHELLAPAVFIDEVAGALTKAERQKDIAVGQAIPLYAKVMNSHPVLIPHAPRRTLPELQATKSRRPTTWSGVANVCAGSPPFQPTHRAANRRPNHASRSAASLRLPLPLVANRGFRAGASS
jgi:predicted nucleic acid-binding protein